jgi:hypothetical protein
MNLTIETPKPDYSDVVGCDAGQCVVNVLLAVQSRQPISIGPDKGEWA